MTRTPEYRCVRNSRSGTLPVPKRSKRKYLEHHLLKSFLFTIVNMLLLAGTPMPLLAEQELTFSALRHQGSYGEVRVRGKASIKVKDLNLIRYQYKIRRQVTAIAAPDVLKLLPFDPTIVSTQEEPVDTTPEQPLRQVSSYDILSTAIANAANQAEQTQQATAELDRKLRAFIAASARFSSETLMGLSRELIETAKKERKWPETQELKLKLAEFLQDNSTTFAIESSDNTLTRIETAKLDSTLTRIEAAKSEWERSEKQIAEVTEHFRAAEVMHDKTQSEISESIDCGFRSRKEELTLLIFDLFPEEETNKATVTEMPLVTFVCEHPISFSTGVFRSSLEEKEFDYRPMFNESEEKSNPTATDAIGYNNKSEFRIMPGIMINTLIYQLSNSIDIHLSFATLADLGGEQGTNIEFIFGGSVGFKKSVFLTAGWHFGRVPELQGGFKIGDPKIEGLDSVPIQKSYQVGCGLGISYNFIPK